jgi:flagellin-like protein
MKGVSPIIATIILIALAITIGMMLSSWITHWFYIQTGRTSVSCALETNYAIESARWNISSTSLNNTLLIKVLNKGSRGIYGFGVVLDNGTRIVQLNSSSSLVNQGGISSSNPLQQEQSAYISVNLTNTTLYYPVLGSTLTEVRVTNDACPDVSQKTTAITI